MLGGNKLLKNPKYALFALAAFVLIPLAKLGYTEYQKAKNEPLIGLRQAAQRINEIAPKKIRDDLQIESAKALPGDILFVKYRVLNLLQEEIDETKLPAYINELKSEMKKNTKENPGFEGKVDSKIKLRQSYHDRKGRYLFEIESGFDENK